MTCLGPKTTKKQLRRKATVRGEYESEMTERTQGRVKNGGTKTSATRSVDPKTGSGVSGEQVSTCLRFLEAATTTTLHLGVSR